MWEAPRAAPRRRPQERARDRPRALSHPSRSERRTVREGRDRDGARRDTWERSVHCGKRRVMSASPTPNWRSAPCPYPGPGPCRAAPPVTRRCSAGWHESVTGEPPPKYPMTSGQRHARGGACHIRIGSAAKPARGSTALNFDPAVSVPSMPIGFGSPSGVLLLDSRPSQSRPGSRAEHAHSTRLSLPLLWLAKLPQHRWRQLRLAWQTLLRDHLTQRRCVCHNARRCAG